MHKDVNCTLREAPQAAPHHSQAYGTSWEGGEDSREKNPPDWDPCTFRGLPTPTMRADPSATRHASAGRGAHTRLGPHGAKVCLRLGCGAGARLYVSRCIQCVQWG